METTVKQRLTDFIQSEGISVRNFERRCGLSSNYLRSLRHTPSEDKLSAILEAFPYLDRVWLLAGVGEMYRHGFGPGGEKGAAGNAPAVKKSYPDGNDTPIAKKSYTEGRPYFNVEFKGGFDLLVNDQTATPDYLISLPQFNHMDVAWCNISGPSMEPEISNGDIICLQPVEDWQKGIIYGEIYGIITQNGMRTVKRIRKAADPEMVTLQPTNPKFDTQDIPKEQIYKLFRVLCAIKRF